jgi:ubiquinone/menaquinone biosynthesis C-methylase UbiE
VSGSDERFVPAAGYAPLTRFYDPFMALTMRESRWRPALVARAVAALPERGTAVDIGAGTGAVTLRLARARPDATIIAVDPDATALDIARAKRGADAVDWREGRADAMPMEEGSADVVVMSLVLHHLAPAAKRAALAEARRVLRPGGSLLVADWGAPRGPLPRAGFALVRMLDGFDGTRDHGAGLLPARIAEAGLTTPRVWKRLPTVWGTLELLEAHPARA